MRPPTDARGSTRLAIVGVGATNVLPILGVVIWDWSLATLLLVYWLEIGIGLWWAAVEAGVAERPSEYPESMVLLGAVRYRRGGVTIPGTALTVYVHNLAMVVLTLFAFGGLWAIVAGVILVSILNWDGVGLGSEAAYSVLAVGAGLFLTRGWETLSTYVRDEQYREVNAQQAIQDALWPLLILGVLVTMFVPAAETEAGGVLSLIALLAGKFGFDLLWVTYGSIRTFDADNGGWLGIAEGPTSEWEPQPLEEPPQFVGDPIRPHRAGVILGGITNAWSSILGVWTALLAVFIFSVLALGGTSAMVWWLVPPLVVLTGFGISDNVLRYWWTTYRFDATGRLWQCGRNSRPHRRLEAVQRRSVRTRVDRLLGTTTVELEDERSERDESNGSDGDVQPITMPSLAGADATSVLENHPETAVSTSRAA